LGGDEFAVILVQADLGTGLAKAASLAQAIESEPAACGDWLAGSRVEGAWLSGLELAGRILTSCR
jgi:predicted NAD/FAD-dependent oxidoreductase